MKQLRRLVTGLVRSPVWTHTLPYEVRVDARPDRG